MAGFFALDVRVGHEPPGPRPPWLPLLAPCGALGELPSSLPQSHCRFPMLGWGQAPSRGAGVVSAPCCAVRFFQRGRRSAPCILPAPGRSVPVAGAVRLQCVATADEGDGLLSFIASGRRSAMSWADPSGSGCPSGPSGLRRSGPCAAPRSPLYLCGPSGALAFVGRASCPPTQKTSSLPHVPRPKAKAAISRRPFLRATLPSSTSRSAHDSLRPYSASPAEASGGPCELPLSGHCLRGLIAATVTGPPRRRAGRSTGGVHDSECTACEWPHSAGHHSCDVR